MSDLSNNPFTALFGSVKNAKEFVEKSAEENPEDSSSDSRKTASVSDILTKITLISTTETPSDFCTVFLEHGGPVSMDTLDSIIFERILMDNPLSLVKNADANPGANIAAEKNVITYLNNVYNRCSEYSNPKDGDTINSIRRSVVKNLATVVEEPAIAISQDPHAQVHSLFLQKLDVSQTRNMLRDLVDLLHERNVVPPVVFTEVLMTVKKNLHQCKFESTPWLEIDIMSFYAASPYLASLLLKIPSSTPGGKVSGASFQNTCLGQLIAKSCFAKPGHPAYFKNALSTSPAEHQATENAIRVSLKAHRGTVQKLFLSLLKGSDLNMRHMLLDWIQQCLAHNLGRNGMWRLDMQSMEGRNYCDDGFMLNLTAVLVDLAMPIISGLDDMDNIQKCKVLKVDPTYCSSVAKKTGIPGIYSEELASCTFLLPTPEDEVVEGRPNFPLPTKYTFSSSCFFMAHRALHIGGQAALDRIKKLSQELNMIQNQLMADENNPNMDIMKKHMESKTSEYLTYTASVFEESFVENLLQFLSASSMWLSQVAMKSVDDTSSLIVYEEISVDKILSVETSMAHSYLRLIPEFMVDTIVAFLAHLDRFASKSLNLCSNGILHHFITFIATFMGSVRFVNNPHLRAQMCECFNALLVKPTKDSGMMAGYRERVLLDHPLTLHLVTAVIDVFVSIEMTGSSVAFEEKFNYRRPMYDVMEYFWGLPSHKLKFVSLAEHSLQNMESAQPPLFLRFVNLLINDAIFLLDEGLSFMAQIREKQIERDSDAWNTKSASEKTSFLQDLRQLKMMARFHNTLGTCTIETLMRFTKDIPKMFTHNTLVDRMAAMLNYFLNNLVGPKQSKLKAKDMDKCEFYPAQVVSNISTIFMHLSGEKSFCMAVCNDGRSYTPQLFIKASKLLNRLGKVSLSDEIELLGKKVEGFNQQNQDIDFLTQCAPDNYLDPLMMHIMKDPVILPSSKIIIDRQTIARHLLSDQSDPFNRQPLTMEEVIPEADLKREIEAWISSELSKSKTTEHMTTRQ